MWRATWPGVSTWPYMTVDVVGMPRRCAVVMISTHVRTSTFLWRQDLAHLVVEDLGGRARDRAEAAVAQHADVVAVGRCRCGARRT